MTSKFNVAGLATFALTLVAFVRPQATMPGGHDVIPYTHATAVRACTAQGAPVLEIFFTRTALPASGEASPPFLRLELPSSPTETIPAGTYILEPSPAVAKPPAAVRLGRASFVTEGHAPVWLTGTLAINSMVPDRYFNGHFRVEMPDGKIAESGFLARYLSVHVPCGG